MKHRNLPFSTDCVFILALVLAGCNDGPGQFEQDENTGENSAEQELSLLRSSDLINTSWKLTRVTNSDGQSFDLVRPQDYIISFSMDDLRADGVLDDVVQGTLRCSAFVSPFSVTDGALSIPSPLFNAGLNSCGLPNVEIETVSSILSSVLFYTPSIITEFTSATSFIIMSGNNETLRFESVN